jgi:hypothetical protein
MMTPTEQAEVSELGLPTLDPGEEVMAVTPGGGSLTAGETAMTVPDKQGPSDPGRDDAGPSPHVERL